MGRGILRSEVSAADPARGRGCLGGPMGQDGGMADDEPWRLIPRPARGLIRMLVGEVKVVGSCPEGGVLLCSNHPSYRDVFLFGLVRPGARLLVHPLVFTFPFLKRWALRWGFVQVDIPVAVDLLRRGQPVAICPTGLVEALGEDLLPYKTGAVRIAEYDVQITPQRRLNGCLGRHHRAADVGALFRQCRLARLAVLGDVEDSALGDIVGPGHRFDAAQSDGVAADFDRLTGAHHLVLFRLERQEDRKAEDDEADAGMGE